MLRIKTRDAQNQASLALFTRLISVAPKRLPRSSKTVPLPFLWRPPLWTLACPAPSGWPPSAPAFLSCSSLCGPPLAPAPRRRIICCWLPSTVSASPDRKPKSRIGMTAPSCVPSGALRPSVLLRKSSGTVSTALRRNNWSKHRSDSSAFGKRSSWSAAAS